ncbi:MAG: hypothetical protein VKI42_01050 [Synechococcaceae cyanobacterium]|nr:hypothetical protein [Synechococcaceae cyanobacterium]
MPEQSNASAALAEAQARRQEAFDAQAQRMAELNERLEQQRAAQLEQFQRARAASTAATRSMGALGGGGGAPGAPAAAMLAPMTGVRRTGTQGLSARRRRSGLNIGG